MASTIMASAAVRPVVLVPAKATKANKAFVSNGSIKKTTAMQVWTPIDNKMFETFSYLPPLTNDQIAKQVDYIVNNGWTPCLEFSAPELAYTSSESFIRMSGEVSCCHYDNRYWTMWKLPMFGCTDASQVLREVDNARRAFPDAYVRLVAFDNIRQVQCAGFLVHRPASSHDWKPVNQRSV